jgi:membrane protein implicated in regulation of membrane protease activity
MLIYGVIAASGLFLLIAMLVIGDLFGGDHDLSHEIAIGHGDVDHGGGPSVFSTRIMAAFLTAFGVGGIVGRYYDLSHPAASGVGVACGVLMSTVVFQFAKALHGQQASSALEMSGLVGSHADVSVAIPAGGVGQVAVSAGGELTEHIARSADGAALDRGAAVVIVSVGGGSVVVRPRASATNGGS